MKRALAVSIVLAFAMGQAFSLRGQAGVVVVTSSSDGGAGSLRNAIQSAQPGTVIRFAVPDGSTIVLSGVLPYIHTDLTIEGPGADLLTISGNNAGRVVVNYAH